MQSPASKAVIWLTARLISTKSSSALTLSAPVDRHGWNGDGEARQDGGRAHLQTNETSKGCSFHMLASQLLSLEGTCICKHCAFASTGLAGTARNCSQRVAHSTAAHPNSPHWRAWRRGPARCRTPRRPPPANQIEQTISHHRESSVDFLFPSIAPASCVACMDPIWCRPLPTTAARADQI